LVLKTTPVFEYYWKFAFERQEIFFRRIAGAPPPWTADPILREFKFTNAYRASDRVSQYLIKHVIYVGDQTPDELIFRILVFKMFNRIETWELLEESLGGISLAAYNQHVRLLPPEPWFGLTSTKSTQVVGADIVM